MVGSRTRGKVVKNKVAAPFREAEFDIIYGEGISFEGDCWIWASSSNLVEKSGTWLSFGGERIGPGPRKRARLPEGTHRHREQARIRPAQETGLAESGRSGRSLGNTVVERQPEKAAAAAFRGCCSRPRQERALAVIR